MTTQAANEELARLREAFTAPTSPIPGESALEPDSCPTPDRIWLGVRGELPPDELRSLLDHIARCQACAEDWRIAREFEDESVADESPGPGEVLRAEPRRAERSRWSRLQSRIAVAAGIILASAFGFQVYQQSQAPKTGATYRTSTQTTIEPILKPGSTLPRERFVIPWKPAKDAVSYTFLASSPLEMESLFVAKDLTSPQVQIPPEALAGLRSGDKVMYMIKAYSSDGIKLADRTLTVTLR